MSERTMYRILDYDRQAAVDYAHRWAYGRNPAYYNFENIGGDCTNFASQCLYAGSSIMNYTQDFGWYYRSVRDRAPAWTGVEFFYNFLTGNQGPGPWASETAIDRMEPGDIIQLRTNQPRYHHTPVIVEIRGDRPSLQNILVAAHSFDADYRPLSSYPIRAIRFLHIEGVRRP